MKGCIGLPSDNAVLKLLGAIFLNEPLGAGGRLENRNGELILPTQPITVSVGSVPGSWDPGFFPDFPDQPFISDNGYIITWRARVVGYVD